VQSRKSGRITRRRGGGEKSIPSRVQGGRKVDHPRFQKKALGAHMLGLFDGRKVGGRKRGAMGRGGGEETAFIVD